jgi:Tol biopolymer transport system component
MNQKIYFGLLILALFFPILACSQFLPDLSRSSPSGKIVYQTDQDGNFELYLIDLRSGESIRLTNNSASDVSPAFISTTNQIGFVSDSQNGWNLYTTDILGKQITPLIKNKDIRADYPSWSADGKFITASLVEDCVAPATTCYYDIYVMNADGTHLQNLTDTPQSEWVPVWSPDDQKIVFSSDRDGDSEIFMMDRDGSNLVQLTENDGYDGMPRWSPDGTKLLFDTDRDGGDWDIYIMNIDGSDPRPVTNNTSNDFSASWSPDGNWFVYISDVDGDSEVYIIDINGQNQKRLTNNFVYDLAPIWIP